MVEQRGFTIVELILVIVILGIISAVAVPRFFDRKAFDERFYFEEALSAVRYGQKLAVASGCYIQVLVKSSGANLFYAQACGDKESGDAVSGDYSAINKQPIEISSEPFTIVFNSLGCVSNTVDCPTGDGFEKLEIGASRLKIYRATGFIEVGQ
ncbi:prepilin-type N-terminal cleavage/methylation domain-containing protein [Pseudomonas sp.]|uniref:prepilin-type N-terminal cleavage/methylation domain-containing protein n=1 Tax=Pseudomonas sp. TaxID=306 RepID=UPI003D0BBBA3